MQYLVFRVGFPVGNVPKILLLGMRKRENGKKLSERESVVRTWITADLCQGRTPDDRLLKMEWIGALVIVAHADNPSQVPILLLLLPIF